MDVKQSTGFYDLCVNVQENEVQNLTCMLLELCKYGYKTIALNTNVDESVFASDKKRKKKSDGGEISQSIISETIDVENIKKKFNGKLQILNRITFLCSDPSKTHILQHGTTLKKYDLYAFAPKTQNALQFACTQLNTDIITLRPSSVTFKLNKKLYEQAIERGVHFEIQYGDLLNAQSRKLSIHYSHLFHTYGKSKHVILSSGSNNVKTIRNPYDLINLSSLLGLNEVKAKAAILHQCKKLLLRAERRRRGKAVFVIEEQSRTNNDIVENDTTFSKRLKL